jgi:SAM-dependent methyltransferase
MYKKTKEQFKKIKPLLYLVKKIKKIVFSNKSHLTPYGRKSLQNKIWKVGRKITSSSIFNRESEMGMCSLFPKKILEEVILLFQPMSVLDLGCGTGKAVDFFAMNKIETIGVEGSSLAIKKSLNPELIKKYNLNKELNLNKKFDIIWSFEFVEHIHPKYVNNLLKSFSNHSDIIIMSAARPGQGGEGHFNEQNDEYWVGKFNEFNYILDIEKTNELRDINETFSKNMYVFTKNI